MKLNVIDDHKVIQSLADEFNDGDATPAYRDDFDLRDWIGEEYTDAEMISVIICHVELSH